MGSGSSVDGRRADGRLPPAYPAARLRAERAGYHGPMRRRPAVPGPMFAWAGDSRWRQVAAWLVRSAIIVVVALAVYVALFYLVLPLVLDR